MRDLRLAVHRHGRHENRTIPNIGIIADDGAMDLLAVEVSENGTRPDVDALPDLSVADVAEVPGAAAGAEGGVLDFGENADDHIFVEDGTFTKIGERPDAAA